MAWLTEDCNYYRYTGVGGKYGSAAHNLRKTQYLGYEIYIPQYAETELELTYGPKWKVYDPHFVWHTPVTVKDIMNNMLAVGWSRFKEYR